MRASESRIQFAIRLPNGLLYGEPAQTSIDPADDYSVPSPARDLNSFFSGMLGLGGMPKSQAPQGPYIYDDRQKAEAKLAELQATASAVGVTFWGGAVVQRFCTPFTSGDPSVDFAEQVFAWLKGQGAE